MKDDLKVVFELSLVIEKANVSFNFNQLHIICTYKSQRND